MTNVRTSITRLTEKHADKAGTTSRAQVIDILGDVTRLEMAPTLTDEQRQTQEAMIFKEVLSALGIRQCLCDQILKLVQKCGDSTFQRWCSCFGDGASAN
jgi:hypothetical protein